VAGGDAHDAVSDVALWADLTIATVFPGALVVLPVSQYVPNVHTPFDIVPVLVVFVIVNSRDEAILKQNGCIRKIGLTQLTVTRHIRDKNDRQSDAIAGLLRHSSQEMENWSDPMVELHAENVAHENHCYPRSSVPTYEAPLG
jgi:hypothetical protein